MKAIVKIIVALVMAIMPAWVLARETQAFDETVPYASVDIYSAFPGGMDGLMTFLSENLQYPERCEKEGVQGRVILEFIVEKDGSIGDVKVLRSADPDLDAEAVRVCRSMPRFKPARDAQTEEPIRVRYTLPVNFKL